VTKAEEQAAYEAGKHSVSIVWAADSDVPQEQQAPGLHHCPFDPYERPEERAAWLRGLEDALGGDRFDPATIIREIRDELKGADRVSK
jgi:hypothetical protein